MRKVIIELSPGAGIWSRLIQQAVCYIVDENIEYDDAYFTFGAYGLKTNNNSYLEEIKKNVTEELNTMIFDYGIDDPYAHIVNYALDQNREDFKDAEVIVTGPPTVYHGRNNPIELQPKLSLYKKQFKRLKFRKEILDQIENRSKILEINEQTLSVHCRMTSLSRMNGNQEVPTEQYFSQIDLELATGNYSNIFLSSDNVESIDKFIRRYGNIVKYNSDFKYRHQKEYVDSGAIEFKYLFKKYSWVESCVDMLMLSRGSCLISRYSYFANAAIVASDSIKKSIRLDFKGDGI